MPSILRGLRLNEISFVDKGANPGARVVFAKRHEDRMSIKERLAKIFGNKESKMPVKKDAPAGGPMMTPTLEEVINGLDDQSKAVIMAALEQAAAKAAPPPPAPAAHPAPGAEPKPPEPAAKSYEGIPDEFVKRLEKAESEAAEGKSEIEKIRKAERFSVFVAKAKAMPFVPGKSEDLARMLMLAADSMTPEAYKGFEKKMSDTNAVLAASGALKEHGSVADDEGASAASRLEKMVDELVTKSEKPLSHSQAYARVVKTKEGRELYNQIEAERVRSVA